MALHDIPMVIRRQYELDKSHDPSHLPSMRSAAEARDPIRASRVIRDMIKVPGTGGVLALLSYVNGWLLTII